MSLRLAGELHNISGFQRLRASTYLDCLALVCFFDFCAFGLTLLELDLVFEKWFWIDYLRVGETLLELSLKPIACVLITVG